MTVLETRFADAEESLGSRRRELVRQILEHPEETYFLSSRALAKHYEVDTATIVRTVQALGYERYADFAADLRAHFLNRITPYALLKTASRENRSIADHLAHNFECDSATSKACAVLLVLTKSYNWQGGLTARAGYLSLASTSPPLSRKCWLML